MTLGQAATGLSASAAESSASVRVGSAAPAGLTAPRPFSTLSDRADHLVAGPRTAEALKQLTTVRLDPVPLVVADAVVALWPSGGQSSESDAVSAYVRAVNAQDVDQLADDIYPGGTAQARRELATVPHPLVVARVDIQHQFGPRDASVTGTAAGRPTAKVLSLTLQDGHWYVAVDSPPGTGPDPGPTAATTKP